MDDLRKLVVQAANLAATGDSLGMKGLHRYEPLRLPEVLDNSVYFWVVYDHSIGCWTEDGTKFKTEAECQQECDRLNQEDANAKR